MAQLNPHTSSSLSTGIMTFLEREFLKILRKNLVIARYGKAKRLNRGQGKTMDWRRWSDLSAATTALSEGVSPDGDSLTLNSVSATLAQYGNFVTVTDFLSMTFINDIMLEAKDLIGYNAALTIDSIVRNEIDTNFTAQYADGTQVGGSNASAANVTSGTDVMRSNEVRAALETLRSADVPEYEDGLFIGIIHPHVEGDLLNESSAGTGMEGLKYTSDQSIVKGLIGTIYGTKLIRSSNIRAVSPDTAVYRNLFFGKDAFGIVDVMGSSAPEIIVHPTGDSGVEDPLNQRGTVGWKATFVAKTLEAARGIVLHSYSV